MISVERVFEYCFLQPEDKATKDLKTTLEKDWPNTGRIQFQGVSLKYEQESESILKDLCFEVNPGEKIGIVGRTGAGKSSIVQAILRMTEPKGTILIDNVNIKELKLCELRSRLSFIPVLNKKINLDNSFLNLCDIFLSSKILLCLRVLSGQI
jgi:ATP-binding cassette subfamily C (CFTR/MRP) protein 4